MASGRNSTAAKLAGTATAGDRALSVRLEPPYRNPMVAEAVPLEEWVADQPAWASQDLVLSRLSHAIESGRCGPGFRHFAPPLTAGFMVGAMRGSVRKLQISQGAVIAERSASGLVFLTFLTRDARRCLWGAGADDPSPEIGTASKALWVARAARQDPPRNASAHRAA